jgi:hypothetical protein
MVTFGRWRRICAGALLVALVTVSPAGAPSLAFGDEEAPPQGPPGGEGIDRPCCPPPPVVYAPAPPRPLSTAAKVVYAPFYATGLVLRYGFYYLFVAPFEVFGRALSYGANGGVERAPRRYAPPPPPAGS